MDLLRTPDDCFENLPDFSYPPQYATVDEIRLHYVSTGEGDPILCLHGEPTWSYLYRKMLPGLASRGRAMALDLVGFGRSDKPAAREDYTYKLHYDSLAGFIDTLDLKRITLVCQDWGGLIGLPLAADMPDRFARLVIMNTGLPTGDEPFPDAFFEWKNVAPEMIDADVGSVIQLGTRAAVPEEVLAAYRAPFPDNTYKAGAFQFPELVPLDASYEAEPAMRRCRQRLAQWEKPAITLFSDHDPITQGGEMFFRKLIPSASKEPEIVIEQAGHFLQEDAGETIAEHICAFIDRNPV